MNYDENDILLHVGLRALEAGRVYQRQRRVQAFDVVGDRCAATVQGNERRPYTQTIVVSCSSSRKVSIHSDCSCPVGENCKHVAAVLLEGLARTSVPSLRQNVPADNRLPQSEKQTAPELPPSLASWLETLEEARQCDSEDYADGQHQRIVYVLVPQTRYDGRVPCLELRILTTRILKNGAFSPKSRSCDWRTALTSATPAKYLRPSDFRIFRKLAMARGSYLSRSSEAPFNDDDALDLLDDILATTRARWIDINSAAMTRGPTRTGRIIWDAGDGAEMRLRLDAGEGLIALNAAPPIYVNPVTGLIGSLDLGLAPKLAFRLVDAPPAALEHVALLSERMAQKVPDLAPLAPPPPAPPLVHTGPPKFILRLIRGELPISNQAPHSCYHYYGWQAPTESVGLARVIFRYGPVDVGLNEAARSLTRFHGGGLVEIHRDMPLEAAALEMLRAAGFVEVVQTRPRTPQTYAHDFFPDDADDFSWLDALYYELPRLEQLGWSVEIDPDFPVRLLAARGEFIAKIDESTGTDWLELDLGVTIDGEMIDLIGPIVTMIGAVDFDPQTFDVEPDDDTPFYLPLADGRFLAMPWIRLVPIVAAIWEFSCGGALDQRDGRLRLSVLDFVSLADFEAATQGAEIFWRGGEKLRKMGQMLTARGGLPEVIPPETFRATLRPYQAQGLSWLTFLREMGLGGVLADDMGLGKTVQALALIAAEKAAGRLNTPALVIAPTSLIENWRCEAEKFAPDLEVLVLHGADRKQRFADIDAADLVLSTYPLISRDHETLAARQWSLLFLDEAQTIKNPNAATTRLIYSLKAATRFCLTGTPLENHLGELWSIFSFALPGFLGDLSSFNGAFRVPIEKKGDMARGKMLARRIRPFLLRRTKEEVANELPPKTEIVERVEMCSGQRDLYESIRMSMHEKVREAIAAKGFARSRIVILDALLKLRQCCCDPRLLKLPAKASSRAGSAKFARLTEMLDALIAEKRRILVFSQFTSMIDLIRPELDARGITYSLLTGNTRDRPRAIKDFQEGRTQVFLISLKAGGVGLNLTAADTVILYDPWWNPAVEEQAIDRAHRIGQNQPVFVHKLVVSGTIEEKMAALKEKKRALAESLFEADGAPTLAMTEADLHTLFAPD